MSPDALMHRPGVPDDIAAAAVYLARDDAAYVTATVLTVAGGLTGAPGTSPFAVADLRRVGAHPRGRPARNRSMITGPR